MAICQEYGISHTNARHSKLLHAESKPARDAGTSPKLLRGGETCQRGGARWATWWRLRSVADRPQPSPPRLLSISLDLSTPLSPPPYLYLPSSPPRSLSRALSLFLALALSLYLYLSRPVATAARRPDSASTGSGPPPFPFPSLPFLSAPFLFFRS